MSKIFSPPPPVVVSTPFQSATSGSTEVTPYAPVEPFIQNLLNPIQQTFSADPELFTGSLVPEDSAQTLAARDLYGQVGQASAGLAPQLMQLGQADISRGLADPSQDPIYQAQLGVIAQQARDMTERDKQTAQQQAIQAGQFGLGSTALGELETLQQQKREELAQRQMATALQEAEARRIAASQRAPGMAHLGSSTQMQQTSSGYGSQGFAGGPSPFSQIASAAATGAKFAMSDKRLKSKITFVGKLENGIKIYKWKWSEKGKELAGDQVEFGVIAQEVQKIVPEAVKRGPDGYLMVNYGALR